MDNEDGLTVEDLAYLIVVLIKRVQPLINEGQSYPFVIDLLSAETISEREIESCGDDIRSTCFPVNPKKRKH